MGKMNEIETLSRDAFELFKKRDFKSAIEKYKIALELDPQNLVIRSNLSSCLLATQSIDEAHLQVQEVLQKDPKFSNALKNAGIIYSLRGDKEKAEHSFRTAIQNAPNDMNCVYQLANFLFGQRRFTEALENYQIILTKHPQNLEIKAKVGTLYLLQGKKEEAAFQYKEILASNPTHQDAQNNLAAIYLQQGSIDEATQLLQSVLAQNPALTSAKMNLALVCFTKGDLVGAKKETEAILEKNAKDSNARLLLGRILMKEKSFDQAIIEFKQALETQPSNPFPIILELGSSQIQRGDFDGAIASFEDGLKKFPNQTSLLEGLGIAHFNQGHPDEGIKHLQASIVNGPENIGAHDALMGMYYVQGRYKESLKLYEELQTKKIEFDPSRFKNISRVESIRKDLQKRKKL